MGSHLVIGPTRTVVRPGADCKFGLCGPQLSFELGKSVHVNKFITSKLFIATIFSLASFLLLGLLQSQSSRFHGLQST